MADKKDENKPSGPIATWILDYYGDDAVDISKKNKIRHLVRTSEFASMVYVISKNSKKAHTDFFKEKYDTLDIMYARAASIIVKLLKVMYSEGRPLTKEDFNNCGGSEMFGSSSNYDEICQDYIGPGGMVEMCDSACFPRPEVEDLLEGKETRKDYKNLPKEEKERRIVKKMAVLYGSFVEDLDEVRSHHSQLLDAVDSKNGTLTVANMKELLTATKYKGANMFREMKGKVSALDFTIKDDKEKSYELHYEITKNTGKLAILGTVAAASLGAVAGGLFWPAFLIFPVYGLGKKWLPDWFNSLGKEWGHFEKSVGHRFESRKFKAYVNYMTSFMETKGKPKIKFADRFFLTPSVIKCLKKGSKSGSESVSFEGSDGELHVSNLDSALNHIEKSMGRFVDGGQLNPVDSVPELNKDIAKLTPGKVSFEDFEELAERIKTVPSVTSDEIYNLKRSYAKKLLECAQSLIFQTKMKTMTDHVDYVTNFFKDESEVMKLCSEVASGDVAMIKRYVAFAGKELTGLQGSNEDGSELWRGKTLEEYIYRTGFARLSSEELEGKKFNNATGAWDGGFNNPAATELVDAIKCIKTLEVRANNDKEVVDYAGHTLQDINGIIGKIKNNDDRKACNDLLKKQMSIIFYNASREDSKASYAALVRGDFTGKESFSDVFKKISEMTYENVGSSTYSELLNNLTKTTKISPPEMGRYLRGKLGKAAAEIFENYAKADENKDKFASDLPFLIEYLKKLNGCSLLNQEQKASLTAGINDYVVRAVGMYTQTISENFMSSEKGYNHSKISEILTRDYAQGGLKQLFETNKSAEITSVKDMFGSLSRLNTAHENLQFGGYSMSATDQRIMGMILTRNGDDGFESFMPRTGDDKLVDFLSNKLKCSKPYSSFSGVDKDDSEGITVETAVKNAIQNAGTPFSELRGKLDLISRGDAGSKFYDKYAALVALKNKIIVESRKCLNKLVQEKRGSSRANDWLESPDGRAFYAAAIEAWNELFVQIDKAIDDLYSDKIASYATDPEGREKFKATFSALGDTKRLSIEKGRYEGVTYTIDLSEEKSLG